MKVIDLIKEDLFEDYFILMAFNELESCWFGRYYFIVLSKKLMKISVALTNVKIFMLLNGIFFWWKKEIEFKSWHNVDELAEKRRFWFNF